MSDAGIKFDNAKPMFGLLPWEPLRQAVWVLMFGKEKYDIDNWQKLENGQRRYLESMTRHVAELWEGLAEGKELWEILDDSEPGGSRMPVIAHVICCALFAMWFSRDDFAHDYDVDWVAPYFAEQRRLARATEELDEDGNATQASALVDYTRPTEIGPVNCRSQIVKVMGPHGMEDLEIEEPRPKKSYHTGAGLEPHTGAGVPELEQEAMRQTIDELRDEMAKPMGSHGILQIDEDPRTDAEKDPANAGLTQDDGTFDSRTELLEQIEEHKDEIKEIVKDTRTHSQRLREAEERIEAAQTELGTALCEKIELLGNPAARS